MRTLKVVIGALMSLNALMLFAAGLVLLLPAMASAQPEAVAAAGASNGAGLTLIGAAIAAAGGCIGAGIAVGYVGAAAVGAVSEKPDMLGKSLIFVGLAEGIAIYGLIISIMIFVK